MDDYANLLKAALRIVPTAHLPDETRGELRSKLMAAHLKIRGRDNREAAARDWNEVLAQIVAAGTLV
jgi:hypothetical protein